MLRLAFLGADVRVVYSPLDALTIARDGGVARPDPFGGSYFLEALTARMEQEVAGYIRLIDDMGGMIAAIERGFPQKEIAEAALGHTPSPSIECTLRSFAR